MKKKASAKTFGVIGLGRFGMALAMTLAKGGKDVIVIDENESKVREMRPYTDYAFVTSNLNEESLREAGIQNCDVVIVCIGTNVGVGILTTLSVIEMGVPRVISKALSTEQGAVLKKIGAEVVYPEKDMAYFLGKRLISDNFLDFIHLNDSVEIRQVRVSGSASGKSIEKLALRKHYQLNIIALERENKTTIEIHPEDTLREGDIISVIGKVEDIDAFENQL
ncbi:potassium transporter TrkA [Drancourtella sp. An57]|mgnify:FL=1|uniref:potassium channel family protein n=1 Tax=Drancourtella sp. An57 TaxID=1965647 RepID=UPI000B39010E|nr:TrkA family potassium uptake protein [Drancourtella sp. An57]OUN68757.1 potassium transporter TrkA [Drancourtella sp. An57]